MDKTICELFAGVGGFRVGFEKLNTNWQTVWFSQYEPSKKNQDAYRCYVSHFGDSLDINKEYHTNDDISIIDKATIPNHTLLVGGFPCQDYSVANSASKGIEGKKGVLWWQIYEILKIKKPNFCIFENVDRILKSPSKQRGRDFGIILTCFAEQNYSVEWRVVNASEYGAAQKRKRTFIFAYRNDINYRKKIKKYKIEEILKKQGFMANAFPIKNIEKISEKKIEYSDILNISNNFSFNFKDTGYMCNGKIYTCKVEVESIESIKLEEILEKNVEEEYYLTESQIEKFKYLKGDKKIPRVSKDGHSYFYREGQMYFPDRIDLPGRTMLTSEGTINRSTHVIEDPSTKQLRFITPIEAERLQGFKDDWTKEMNKRMRYFCMGNALVVPMITRMGKVLDKIIEEED